MFSTTVEVLWVTRLTNSRNRWVYTAQKIITIGTQTLLMHKDIIALRALLIIHEEYILQWLILDDPIGVQLTSAAQLPVSVAM